MWISVAYVPHTPTPTQCKLKSTPSLDQQCLYNIGHLSPLCLTAEIPQLTTGTSRMNIRPTGVSFTFFFIQHTKCTCAHLVSDVYEWQKCRCNSGNTTKYWIHQTPQSHREQPPADWCLFDLCGGAWHASTLSLSLYWAQHLVIKSI